MGRGVVCHAIVVWQTCEERERKQNVLQWRFIMSSIYAIDHNVTTDARLVEEHGGYGSTTWHFTCDFRVFYRGLNHVAGIIYSTDGWASRAELFANFSGFAGDVEYFSVDKRFENRINVIEYVIWCEDYRCIDDVKKIYKTSPLNGGEPFIVRI